MVFDSSSHQIYYHDCKSQLINLPLKLICPGSFAVILCHFINNLVWKSGRGAFIWEGEFIMNNMVFPTYMLLKQCVKKLGLTPLNWNCVFWKGLVYVGTKVLPKKATIKKKKKKQSIIGLMSLVLYFLALKKVTFFFFAEIWHLQYPSTYD